MNEESSFKKINDKQYIMLEFLVKLGVMSEMRVGMTNYENPVGGIFWHIKIK
jgi:hypothetical protein